MANRTIHFSQLEVEIVKALSEYSEEVAEGVQKEVEDVATELVNTLKKTSPRETGEYARGWTQKTEYKSRDDIRIRVYNRTKPQITHLLENGHAKVNGGRVDGIPHIRPAEQNMVKKLGDAIKVVVK